MSEQNLPHLDEPALPIGAEQVLDVAEVSEIAEIAEIATHPHKMITECSAVPELTEINSVPARQVDSEAVGAEDATGHTGHTGHTAPACYEELHKNTVAMTINTAGMQFKFNTSVENSRESIELAAKLDLALTLLVRSESRLEEAMIKIGDLQATVRRLEEKRPSQ